jgi:hypothetical protein
MVIGRMRNGKSAKKESKSRWVDPWLKKINKRQIRQPIMKGNPMHIEINIKQLIRKS